MTIWNDTCKTCHLQFVFCTHILHLLSGIARSYAAFKHNIGGGFNYNKVHSFCSCMLSMSGLHSVKDSNYNLAETASKQAWSPHPTPIAKNNLFPKLDVQVHTHTDTHNTLGSSPMDVYWAAQLSWSYSRALSQKLMRYNSLLILVWSTFHSPIEIVWSPGKEVSHLSQQLCEVPPSTYSRQLLSLAARVLSNVLILW